MEHVAKLNIHGDPNIGLYGVATDKYCLVSKAFKEKHGKKLEQILQVPVIGVKIYGTDLVGVFTACTSKCVLLPKIIFESELKELKAELKKLDVSVSTLNTDHTALGNNILCNDKTGVISKIFSVSEKKKIETTLGIKLKVVDFDDIVIAGALGTVTSKGGLVSSNLNDQKIEELEKIFKTELGLGTVNLGNPFVRSGIIANSKGFIIGAQSSGSEIMRADESLGFLS